MIKQGMLKRVPGLEKYIRSRNYLLRNKRRHRLMTETIYLKTRTRHRLMTNLTLFTHSKGISKHLP